MTVNGESEMEEEVVAENVEVNSGFVGVVQAQNDVSLTSAGAGLVAAANNIRVEYGGAGALVSGGNLELTSGGGFVFITGGDLSIKQGGGQVLISGGSVNVEQGGAALMLTPNATLSKSYIMMLVSAKTNLADGSRVLLGTPQALALGAALGIVFAVLSRLIGRRG
jgi:hypothetical protein